jgi:hypothetical protein
VNSEIGQKVKKGENDAILKISAISAKISFVYALCRFPLSSQNKAKN